MKTFTRHIAVFSILSVGSLILNGCGRSLGVNGTASPTKPSAQVSCFNKPADANNLLALDLYKQYQSNDGNVFFSPFSISSALAMTYEGAKGQTASEMLSVLHLESDPIARKNDYQAVFAEINKPDKKYKLKTSNNLWLEKDFTFLTSFLDTVTNFYSAFSTQMNFFGDPEGSRQAINGAVSDQTEGKINDLLPSGSINDQTRLVLTNAIYFKASWMHKFEANSTYPSVFNVTPGQSIQAPTMHQQLSGVVENFPGNTRVLELPYEFGDVSMFIFLPAEGGMADLENNLTSANLKAWLDARAANTVPPYGSVVDLSLPKFKFDADYDMEETLSALGMPTAFKPFLADFSGMATLGPTTRLNISRVLHKAFVEVNEDGTEAAAATAVVVEIFTSVSIQPIVTPVPFHVDHPFVFMIYENKVKTILIMGRVNDPNA